MKSVVSLLAVVLASAVLVGTAGAQDQSVDQEVANAVLPLPEDLKADATVVTYEPDTGIRKVLRQGTNIVECQPEDPETEFTRCYNKILAPRNDLTAKLRAEGKSPEEIQTRLLLPSRTVPFQKHPPEPCRIASIRKMTGFDCSG